MERIALAYSDGSFGIMIDGWPMERIVAECEEANRGERDPESMTKIVKVRLEVLDEIVVRLRKDKVRCKCGREFHTRGGLEECLASNHRP